MKLKLLFNCLFILIILKEAEGQKQYEAKNNSDTLDYISALKDTLMLLLDSSGNELFKIHCNSIISVIESKSKLSKQDSSYLKLTYDAFKNDADTANPKYISSYLKRQRPFILAWVSPTDSTVSFSWLRPPKNWASEKEYPLYILLHGDWVVASNSIQYLTYPFITEAFKDSSFNDGYLLQPWSRGNLYSQGMTIPDFWEGIAALEKTVKINPAKKYLAGHSMGGQEAWYIASKSANSWAALGVYSGVLGEDSLLTAGVAENMKNLPTYFVCGTLEPRRLEYHQIAYNLLDDAGNPDIKLVTYPEGHVYLEENVENMYLWMREFVNEDWNTDIIKTPQISQNEPRISCYPNPVITFTNIRYYGNKITPVTINIYDIYGRYMAKVADVADFLNENVVVYDATGLSTGIYILRIKSGDVVAESKMIVVR